MQFDFETVVPKRRSASLSDVVLGMPGTDALFLGAEPLYPTAPAVTEAVTRMARDGRFGYTVVSDDYRDAVVWWMQQARGFAIGREWVVPTLGIIHSLAVLIRMLCREGESIIVSNPVYNRYEQAARRLGRNTVRCELVPENGRYVMDFGAVERAMERPDTRLFVLCNPHNPCGLIRGQEELAKLAALSQRYGVPVFSDEIFAENSLSGNTTPCYLSVPGAESRAVVAISLGKAFGTTGFNHANMIIADSQLREAFLDRRDREHFGSIDPVAAEAMIAAYTPEGLAWLRESNRLLERNMQTVRAFFAQYLPDVPLTGGEGGYLLWIDWRSRFTDEGQLMDFLHRKARFFVDAGSHYGAPCFTRMSLACPARLVEGALGDLKKAL